MPVDTPSSTSADAFGREVRTFSCEHGTLVKTEGLGSEAWWPVRLICPQGCDIEFERPSCGDPAPVSRFTIGDAGDEVQQDLACTRETGHPVIVGSVDIGDSDESRMHTARDGSRHYRWTDEDENGARQVRASLDVGRDQFWGPFK